MLLSATLAAVLTIAAPAASAPAAPAVPAGQTALVASAKKELAKRIKRRAAAIHLRVYEEVTWPDASLGCPKPGMVYAQALTPGYRIVFLAMGEKHEYHGKTGGAPVYCDDPQQAAAGTHHRRDRMDSPPAAPKPAASPTAKP